MVIAEAVCKMQKIKNLYFRSTIISYFLICKLYSEVCSASDTLNLMTIKVISETIDLLKAQVCTLFAKSGLFWTGVCHNFSIKVKNEGTGASKTLSKYATRNKCSNLSEDSGVSSSWQWLRHHLPKWNHHWTHIFLVFQCQCTWTLTIPLSRLPFLSFSPLSGLITLGFMP